MKTQSLLSYLGDLKLRYMSGEFSENIVNEIRWRRFDVCVFGTLGRLYINIVTQLGFFFLPRANGLCHSA